MLAIQVRGLPVPTTIPAELGVVGVPMSNTMFPSMEMSEFPGKLLREKPLATFVPVTVNPLMAMNFESVSVNPTEFELNGATMTEPMDAWREITWDASVANVFFELRLTNSLYVPGGTLIVQGPGLGRLVTADWMVLKVLVVKSSAGMEGSTV